MKKSLFIFALAAGLMALGSCAGNKAEKAEGNAENTEVAVKAEADANVTPEQKKAMIAAGLVGEADFEKPIFIDFNATWCGPCRQFAPFYEAAAEKYADRGKFLEVDVDVYGEVANAFGVQSIPMVVALLPNKPTVTYVGTQDIIGDGVFEAIVDKLTK
ncbi:MAG: thioredoxin [Muribaculaceae bacterium]|nr:thioredoxin [Muribaculaceae bacterium]